MTRKDKIKAMNVALRLQGVTLDSNQVDNVMYVYDSIVANDGKTSLDEMYGERTEILKTKISISLGVLKEKLAEKMPKELNEISSTPERYFELYQTVLQTTYNKVVELIRNKINEFDFYENSISFLNHTEYLELPIGVSAYEGQLARILYRLFIDNIYEQLV